MIDLRKDTTSFDIAQEPDLEAQAEAIADEILDELDLSAKRDSSMTDTTYAICVGHANGDILSESEMDMEKVARLRALVQSGRYRVNTRALAAALMASGDLS